jgi:beta-lactamase class A
VTSSDRRALLAGLSGSGLLLASSAQARGPAADLRAAVADFVGLSGSKSFRIDVGEHGRIFRQSYKAVRPMFIGSAVKTFILTRYLQEVERGARTLGELFTVDDRVRSLSSPVLEQMHGLLPARGVLEAMITHSDNTATDIALGAVGVETVRAFLREHRYTSVLVPDSTRVLFSYLAGAPDGVDKGWKGMEQIMADRFFGEPRPAINLVQSMMATANDLVTYYGRALRGDYFTRPGTLTEFRRIQAMADALALTVPPGVAAYGKGGSIDWQGFHAFCLPGQMVLGRAGIAPLPVTFCFTYNWTGPDDGVPAAFAAYVASVKAILAQVTRLFG